MAIEIRIVDAAVDVIVMVIANRIIDAVAVAIILIILMTCYTKTNKTHPTQNYLPKHCA
jgi:hypothetical protein